MQARPRGASLSSALLPRKQTQRSYHPQELKLEVDDLDRARDRAAAAEHVKAVQQRLDGCTKLYRQAVVTSKRQIDSFSHLSARDELLSTHSGQGRDSPSPYGSYGRAGGSRMKSPGPGQTQDDALMSATSDVTEGLRRTLQLMQSEVDRSLVSNELLQSQTQTMQLTSDEYSTLSSLMTTSKKLITSLERADVVDRLLLFGTFAFFVAVCAHIFKKRVLDRGIRVAGALGHIAARGGSLVGGAAKLAGVGKHLEQAHTAPGGAAEVVRSEVLDEVAHAAATATAVVTAIRAGMTSLAGRARDEGVREPAPAAAPFEDVLMPEVEKHAAPVERDVEPEEEEVYEDAVEEPLLEEESEEEEDAPIEPVQSVVDEATVSSSAPPLPSSPTQVDSSLPASSSSTSDSPSATPTPEPEPAAQLPLDSAPAPEEGHGLFSAGDPDLHRVPPPLPSDAEPVESVHPVMPPYGSAGRDVEEDLGHLEEVEIEDLQHERRTAEPELERVKVQEQEPVPEEVEQVDLPDVDRVSLRLPHPPTPTPSAGVFDDPTEDEEGEEEPVEEDEQREDVEPTATPAEPSSPPTATEKEEKLFTPLSSLRPTRPDLDTQLGDINSIVEANRVEPPPASSSSPSSFTDEDEADEPVDLPSATLDPSSDALPESTTMPQSTAAASGPDLDHDAGAEPAAPVHIPVDDPALVVDSPAGIVHAAHDAEGPREVAGPEGTTVPLTPGSAAESELAQDEEQDAVEPGTVPPLDVDEQGAPAAAAEGAEDVPRQMDLPVDLAAEQSLWDEPAESASGSAGEPEPELEEEKQAEYVPEEQGDEKMLEEMLETSFGGVGGFAQGGIGAANATSEDAGAGAEEVEEQEEEQVEPEAEEPPAFVSAEVERDDEGAGEEALEQVEKEQDEQEVDEQDADEQEVDEKQQEGEDPTAVPPTDGESAAVEDEATLSVPPAETSPSPSPSADTLATDDAEVAFPAPVESFEPVESVAAPTSSSVEEEELTDAPSATPQPEVDDQAEPPHASSSSFEDAPTPTPAEEVPEATLSPPPSSTSVESALPTSSDLPPAPSPAESEDASATPSPTASALLEDEDAKEEYDEDDSLDEDADQLADAPSLDEPASSTVSSAPEPTAPSTPELDIDADIANSDALYPDASVEEEPSALEEDLAGEAADDIEDGHGVFESAAGEAVEQHVGEDVGGEEHGEGADEALHQAEERLHELEEEGGAEDEFDLEEAEHQRDEL
ncbi:hypothetical protein JCM10207_006464 [Rhodosporidiobolus poonsookiae]